MRGGSSIDLCAVIAGELRESHHSRANVADANGLWDETPLALPSRAKERWSPDFVSDTFNRGCLGLVAGTSLSGRRLARELDAVIAQRGKPRTIVFDNLVSSALKREPCPSAILSVFERCS